MVLIRTLLLISILALTAACVGNPRLNITGMPHPPKGPPDYVEGWEAGCRTGMTAYSNSYLRNRYQMEVDGARMQNIAYNRGWELGQSYCSYYTTSYVGSKEFTPTDWRTDNSWFNIKNEDGFFTYAGAW